MAEDFFKKALNILKTQKDYAISELILTVNSLSTLFELK